MICNHCFSQIPDGESVCPFCKKRVAQKRFQINIPEEKLNEEFPVRRDEAAHAAEKEQTAPQVQSAEKKQPVPEAVSLNKAAVQKPEKPQLSLETQKPEALSVLPEQKTALPKAPEAKKPAVSAAKVSPAAEKKEKKARAVVLSICSLCAAAMIALTFVSKYTDVFKTSGAAVKTVALSGFTHGEKSSFESYAGFFPAFFKSGFNLSETTQEKLLETMQPQSADGLYSAFFKPADVVTDKADPAERFKSGEGYSYCKIKKEDVEKILSNLGRQAVNCANGREYYYYNGYYYFAAESTQKQTKLSYSVDIASSKRTEDGKYYVQCDFTAASGEKKTVYCLVSMEKSDEGNKWSLIELSLKPLFSSDGVKIASEKQETLSYEIKRKSIAAKTKKGVLFANYIIEYPVFSAADDDEKGKSAAATLNTLYNDMISKYQKKAKKADSLYSRYLKKGGKKKDLPAYIYVSSEVVYNENGYISLLEETNEYLPIEKQAEPAEQTEETASLEEKPALLFPTTSFDAYTLDVSAGEFVKKDSVLGKDYVSVQQKLFELYFKSRNGNDSEVPADTENIGQLISSSAWCVSQNGVLFNFIDPDGYNDSIVLSYGDISDAELKF